MIRRPTVQVQVTCLDNLQLQHIPTENLDQLRALSKNRTRKHTSVFLFQLEPHSSLTISIPTGSPGEGTPVQIETLSDHNCDGEPVSGTAKKASALQRKLANWAIGFEYATKWHVFQRIQGDWRPRKLLYGLRGGFKARFLKELTERNGWLSKSDALRLLKYPYDPSDAKRRMSTVKSGVSRLRRSVLDAIGIEDQKVDPFPYDQQSHGWQAAIEIGYAVQEDTQHTGGGHRLRFRTHKELTQ